MLVLKEILLLKFMKDFCYVLEDQFHDSNDTKKILCDIRINCHEN